MRAIIPNAVLKVADDVEALTSLGQQLPLWVNPMDAHRGDGHAQCERLATITEDALSPQDARNQRVDVALRPNPKSDDGPGHGFVSVIFFIAGSLKNMLVSGNNHDVRHTPSVERCDKAQQRRYCTPPWMLVPLTSNARALYRKDLERQGFTLKQCFDQFTESEVLDDSSNKYFCAKCKVSENSIMFSSRFVYPYSVRRPNVACTPVKRLKCGRCQTF
jgi:hypothetical protein